MTRASRLLLASAVWLVPTVLAALPDPARASYLNFVEAQRDNTGGVDGLQGIEGVIVSPDGRHVYATSDNESALAVFSRNPSTGALTFVQVKKDGVGGVDGLRDAQTVSLSPDGLFVYVAGRLDNAIAVFRRDAVSGTVSFVEVVRNGAAGVSGITGIKHVIISPDGAYAYAAGHDDASLVAFRRDATTGKLTFVAKSTDGVADVDGLAEVRALAISPDGATLYAASKSDSAVSVFRRDQPSGMLTFVQVLKNGVGGVAGLAKTRCVFVSPDGDTVYATGGDDDALAVFRRDPATGLLTFLQVVRDGVDGVDGLNDAQWVTVSPDGTHVLAAGEVDDAVAVFARDPHTGQLTFVEVQRDGVNGVDGMNGPQPLAFSPDGSTLYVGGHAENALAVFHLACGDGVLDAGEECDDGNALGGDCCSAACRFETAGSSCPDDGNACTSDVCNASGSCTHTANTDPCDDGAFCTVNDTCSGGVCRGTARDCSGAAATTCQVGACNEAADRCDAQAKPNGTTCSDGNACTLNDACQAGTCTGSVAPNGTTCSDGNACTQADSCQAGACTGANPVVCAAPDQCHTAGTCNPATGSCSNPAKPNGTACSDNNACTLNDACQSGTCAGSVAPNGTACSDGNACTQADSCQAGACTGANPVVCAAPDQCHTAGTCNPATGSCSNPAKPDGTACSDNNACTLNDACQTGTCAGSVAPNGTACSDGNACTQADSCQAGTCTGANPVVCAAPDQCHTAGTCNPATGSCSNPAKPDGTTCSDNNACTLNDACQTGTCAGSVAPNGTACADGNACTQADSCRAGTCTGANPVVCADPDQCHTAGTCDPATGSCSNPALPDGTTCSDDNACTVNDACQGGSCAGSVAPNGTACSDGNACTQADSCQAGACTGANPVVCTAQDQCHSAGTCHPATGSCSNPVLADGTACSDDNACTRTDRCEAGACVGADAIACAAQDQCHTAGTCDPATGICSTPAQADGATCDDGNSCTASDACQGGTCAGVALADGSACNDGDACTRTDECLGATCAGTNPVVCSAQDQCHEAGSCDPANGICSDPAKPDGSTCNDANECTGADACQAGTCAGTAVANGTACGDGNACTRADACQTGACTGSDPVVCSAQDQCHEAGVCDPASGVCSNPDKADGTRCDDGDACTQYDACSAGACAGSDPVLCTAQDQCHAAGTCDPATGICSTPASTDGVICDDGNACTRTDACSAGACLGDAVVCTAKDQCHDTGACDPATGVCANPAKTDGVPCTDGNTCTDGDICTGGLCAGMAARADGATCDDDNGCTQTDTCQAGFCVGSNPVMCAALDACHLAAPACDPATGTCPNPLAPDATACDDSNPCTANDTCQAGVCTGATRACPATDPCHEDGVCDTHSGGCVNAAKPDGAICDDGNACTLGDVCQAGTCTGGTMPDRDDDTVCDLIDVCPDIPNPDQLDTDRNGVGDVCECNQPAPGRCIAGGGGKKSDCLLEFNTTGPVTYNRKHTKVKRILKCTDGDPTCDLDRTQNGTCVFGVSSCLSNADPRFPRCHMTGPLGFEVMKPKTSAKSSLDRMNMWALEEMLRAMGLEIRRRDAVYTPGQVVTTPDMCSPLIHLSVPAPADPTAKPVRRTFRVRTTLPDGKRDRDRFKLECRG